MGVELFYADGHKLIVAFRNFANAPKNVYIFQDPLTYKHTNVYTNAIASLFFIRTFGLKAECALRWIYATLSFHRLTL
jgi:hypothetical protein